MASVMSVTESVAEKSARAWGLETSAKGSGRGTSSTASGPGKSAKASGLGWAMTMRVQVSAMPTSG
jgi:hypothetical protein